VKRRLASADDNPLHPARELTEPFQDLFKRHVGDTFRPADQLGVVAEGAAEVAPRQKNDGRELPRPVDERRVEEAFYT
jgi:hypothetical protein